MRRLQDWHDRLLQDWHGQRHHEPALARVFKNPKCKTDFGGMMVMGDNIQMQRMMKLME
jgi:hypothetical protein